jgi:hypothetical protein
MYPCIPGYVSTAGADALVFFPLDKRRAPFSAGYLGPMPGQTVQALCLRACEQDVSGLRGHGHYGLSSVDR